MREEHLDLRTRRKLNDKQRLNKKDRANLASVLYEEAVKYQGGYLPGKDRYILTHTPKAIRCSLGFQCPINDYDEAFFPFLNP